MQRVGRYRITRAIARGGMAEVFEAVAEGEDGFRRNVALKRILPQDDDADGALERMFLDEARIASRLHHANIVAVLDYGIADGQPFQVLELVQGMHARALQRKGAAIDNPMPEAVALHICAEVAHALEHAHSRTADDGAPLGIVHRDVSPSNVLVSWDGDVKLSDFGIAFAHDRQEETADGVTKGKLSYMSPEQGHGSRVDARSDVFSLGCVLHALFTGESPLAGSKAFSLLFGNGELTLDGELPDDVREICARAVASQPSDRYSSAGAMATALEAAAARRLDGGARTTLRGWMAGLRRAKRPKGRLDALLDVAIVLDGGPESRSFRSTSADSELDVTVETPRTEPAASFEPSDDLPVRVPMRPIHTGLAFAALALVGAAASAFVYWPEEPSALPPPAHVSNAEESPTLAPDAPPDTVVGDTVPVPDESDPPTSSAPEPSTDAPTRTVAARHPRPGRAVTPAETDPPAALATGPAFLLVGGAAALRAEILVDGQRVGYAPRRLELPLGAHLVELITPEGERLGPRRVQLTGRHTRLSPARWIVDPP